MSRRPVRHRHDARRATAPAVGIAWHHRDVGFDISSILEFQPPSYLCPACRGLIGIKFSWVDERPHRRAKYSCPVCNVEYVQEDFDSSDPWGGPDIYDHFRSKGLVIDHRDLFAHATALAEVVKKSRSRRPSAPQGWPTARTFFEVISRARYFVHFTSWGISHIMVGALKMASMRVPVYGFVSNVDANTRAELVDFPTEAPNLTAKVIPSEQSAFDAPHQKLVVVDGLVAFKGSTNLTNAGLRRADRQLDISEVVTDFAEVTKLNNKYFAPVWRRITSPEEQYLWSTAPF